MNYWTKRDGATIDVQCMSMLHLENSVAMLKRKYEELHAAFKAYDRIEPYADWRQTLQSVHFKIYVLNAEIARRNYF